MLMCTDDRRDADVARRLVGQTVPHSKTLAFDSLPEEIYAHALDELGVSHEGVTSVRALRRLFDVATARGHNKRVAFDAAGDMTEKFPNASRPLRKL